jgi:hypothetical protein
MHGCTYDFDLNITEMDIDDASIKDLPQISANIYPNPTDGILNITTPSNVDISITDVTGKTVYTNKNIGDNTTIDLTFLHSGVYFAKIKSVSGEKNEKIIIK